VRDPRHTDAELLRLQNEGHGCPYCNSTSGHFFHCVTINPEIAAALAELTSIASRPDDRLEIPAGSFTEADKIIAHGLGVIL